MLGFFDFRTFKTREFGVQTAGRRIVLLLQSYGVARHFTGRGNETLAVEFSRYNIQVSFL
jgi:hypothetical protein